MVKDDLISIELFNGNGVFGISLFVPCAITYINKNIIHQGIECIDRINGVEVIYDMINDINKFSDVDIYPRLKEKIKNIVVNENNLFDRLRQKQEGSFWVNLAQIRGHVKDTNKLGLGMDSDMLVEDFYTMCTKDLKISIEARQQRELTQFCFKSKIEADNFLNYVKSKFARFCLSIYKNNGNLYCGEMKLIPWLDFTQEWSDEKLYKHFNITQEEVAFIEKVIPKYY
jgi:hypothetical protein